MKNKKGEKRSRATVDATAPTRRANLLGQPLKTFDPVLGPPSQNLSVLSVLTTILALAPVMPTHAACTPAGTTAADTIVCTGSDTQGVAAQAGNDSISIQSGATVNVSGSGVGSGSIADASPVPVTAVNAGIDNDTVTNLGTASSTASLTQTQSPSLPTLGISSYTVQNHVISTSVALEGGAGNDTLDNRNAVSASASTTATNVSLPLTIAGGDTVVTTTVVDAIATGMNGGNGVDVVINSGTVTATASSQINMINVEHNIVDMSHGSANTTVNSTAIGMIGGDGAGSSTSNVGSIDAAASARTLGVNLEMNGADAATADAKLTVNATAIGMQSGVGGGTISNSGAITTAADAHVLDVGVNVSYLDVTVADRKTADTGTQLQATANGIDASRATGDMTVTHTGSINAVANSDVHAIAIALASEGFPSSTIPVFEGLPSETGIASIGITAASNANGIVGGSGNDRIDSSGTIDAQASANARQDSINVGISLIDWKIPTPGIVLGSAGTGATSTAVGIDGGAGDDAINNASRVTANADATASALTVSANISGFTDNALGGGSIPILGSLSASLSVADTTTKASATAVGIQGGDGNDTVLNAGTIESNAGADAGSISVAASLNIKYKEGENLLAANAVAARAISLSEATAAGIDGGAGNDTINNTATITSNADAEVLNVAASITVGGTVKGAGGGLNLSATDTSGIANATATGIAGGAGDDTITNAGSIQATSTADVTSASAALSVGFAKQGVVVDVSLARAESVATATSVGINGDDGNDTITNNNTVDAQASADAKAISVSVSVSGTVDGVAISGALTKTQAQANATAIGIDGGAGDDTIVNAHNITAQNVNSDALAAAISVSVAGTNNGVAAGVSFADTSAHANSVAQGIQGGDGDDNLRNNSSILLQNVTADSLAASISLSMNAAMNAGVAAGGAMATSSAGATSNAVGIDGGAGNDTITNTGTITAQNVTADADAISVAVSANLSMAGAVAGLTYADTSSSATTNVKGIDGGAGNDVIHNSGAINVQGDADVGGVSVDVNIGAALGIGLGAEIAKTDSTATSTAIGIDGGSGRNDIVNAGAITAAATSESQALSVSAGVTLAFGGDATLADAKSTANATAIGINNDGDPYQTNPSTIDNGATVTATANATSHGTSVSGNLRGFALGETTNRATAEAYGIRTGDGSSTILNHGALNATSVADASGLSIAATLAGKAMGNADTVADARAIGISGGRGNDQVDNSATITAVAGSHADAITFAVDLAGSTDADLRTESLATARGISGGNGTNTLINRSTIIASADAGTSAVGASLSLAGTAHADASTTAAATASGLSSGAGNDTITHLGSLDVNAIGHANVFNVSWTLLGTNGNDAGTSAQATATGIDAGGGNDTVLNHSTQLRVNATSITTLDSSSWAMAGTANDTGTLDAVSRATGIDGGSGADSIRNETAISANASATLEATGGANTIFGNAGSNTKVAAEAYATGLNGGDGNDTITNLGALTVNAGSAVTSTKASFSFAGGANIDELLKSKSRAVGIDGGAGDNVIYSDAAITVTSTAEATTNGSAKADLGGGTSASGRAVADAAAIGISTGTGNDQIENRGALSVTATISPLTNNSSSAGVFFGSGQVEGRIVGTLDAAGIDAGDGNNTVVNRGNLTVNAFTASTSVANTYASGSDFSFFTGGSGNGYSETRIDATATGIRAGNGNNNVLNTGAMAVHLDDTVARGYTDPNGGATSGSGNGTVDAIVSAWGSGIQLGDGANIARNDGTIDVYVKPGATATADSDGSGLDNGNATVNGYSYGEASGISTGNGSQQIISNGAIRVIAAPISETFGDSNGGGTGGDGNATANNYATAKAYGIRIGDGNAYIENNALLSVTATPNARAYNDSTNTWSDGHGNGDAVANVYSQSMSEAVGIKTGLGMHTIINTGTIAVTANATATGGWRVDGGGGPAGHSYAALTTYAEGGATGIELGGGDTTIVNRGDITALATPTTSLSTTIGDGGPFVMLEKFGTAHGITDSRSSGNVTITNYGHITANATGSISIVDDGDPRDPVNYFRMGGAPSVTGILLNTDGHKEVVNNGTISVSATADGPILDPDPTQRAFAIGIQATGSSNVVINNGTISATTTVNGVTANGLAAIYIGTFTGNGGDNTVGLGPTSVTNGNIFIGGWGNTTFVLEGNPVLNGNIVVNNPQQPFSLVLNNAGSFSNTLPTVTNATKNGSGIFTLPTLNTVRSLVVNQGTLSVGGNYQFSNTGLFQTNINGDGSNGRFTVGGTATLGGTMRVLSGGGIFQRGATFDVVTAGSVAGNSHFTSIELPQSTALVSFHTEQLPDRVRVSADVESFTTVVPNAGQNSVAQQLDTLLPTATGDLRNVLGQLQGFTTPQQFTTAFHTLSPAFYSDFSGAAFSNVLQYANVLHERVLSQQADNLSPTFESEPVKVAYSGNDFAKFIDARAAQQERSSGLWVKGFSQKGDQNAVDQMSGFEYSLNGSAIGYDVRLGNRGSVGVSIGSARNHMKGDLGQSDGYINSTMGSVYAGYFNQGLYFSGTLSAGNNSYEARRDIVIGGTTTSVTSKHSGDVLAASVGGGYFAKLAKWQSGPFANLQYTRVKEDRFVENGSGAGLIVDGRTTSALSSVLGGRVLGFFDGGSGNLWIPEFSLGWVHDFGIDNRVINASYVDAPDASFAVDGQPVKSNGALVGAGISYRTRGGFTASLKYTGESRDDRTSQGFLGELRYEF